MKTIKNKFLTIFTPTYNRGSFLRRLFRSLELQTNQNFEWLIVDDGSTDETYNIIKEISKFENAFEVKYIYQDNSGKHVAINNAIEEASGSMFFIVDSDDYLPSEAVSTIYNLFTEISEDDGFAGISCMRSTKSGDIGAKLKNKRYYDITNLERSKYGIIGDRAEVYKLSILKENKFPVFENEKFITEAVVWDKIAFSGKKLRFFNDVIYNCEYQLEGLSNNISNIFLKNWNGYIYYVNQQITYRKSFLRKLNLIFHFCRLAKMKNISSFDLANKLVNTNVIGVYLGYLFCDYWCLLTDIFESRRFKRLINRY